MTHQKFSEKFGIQKHRLQRLIYRKQKLTDKIKEQLDTILADKSNYTWIAKTPHKNTKEDIQSATRICNKCNTTKPFTLSSYKNPMGKSYKYFDGHGHWNGHTCSECHATQIKNKYKKKERTFLWNSGSIK